MSDVPPQIFFGTFHHSLDGKNRFTIPARWRVPGSGEFFLTHNSRRGCLIVLPAEVFRRIGDEAKTHAASPAEHRLFLTNFYSQAMACTIDGNGRMLVPDELCQKAKLGGEVVLAGVSDRFEIWNPPAWEAQQSRNAAAYEELAERMGL